jgi:hypothetical protein
MAVRTVRTDRCTSVSKSLLSNTIEEMGRWGKNIIRAEIAWAYNTGVAVKVHKEAVMLEELPLRREP